MQRQPEPLATNLLWWGMTGAGVGQPCWHLLAAYSRYVLFRRVAASTSGIVLTAAPSTERAKFRAQFIKMRRRNMSSRNIESHAFWNAGTVCYGYDSLSLRPYMRCESSCSGQPLPYWCEGDQSSCSSLKTFPPKHLRSEVWWDRKRAFVLEHAYILDA